MTGPLFSKPSRRALVFWASLAALNLTAGVVVSLQPQRLSDLETIQMWSRRWLADRANIYLELDWAVDYPPNAIVVLAPLGALPFEVAHPLWLMLNLAMAVLAPYAVARFLRPHEPFRVIALPVLLFLCWGGVRTLTQFSLAALACSTIAMAVADRARMAGGMWLGVAMMKPQVALPVFLWGVFTRRWIVALTSLATAGALYAVFCLWSGAHPLDVLARYADVLMTLHTGDAILSGVSELRPLIGQFTGAVSATETIVAWTGLCLLAGICVAGFIEGALKSRVMYAAPPLVACWVLLSFYHLTYGFVILLPVMMLLALNDSEASPLRRRLFWFLQLAMMFDIPGLSRLAGLADTGLDANLLAHGDRAVMLMLFAGLVVLAWRESEAASHDAEARRRGADSNSVYKSKTP